MVSRAYLLGILVVVGLFITAPVHADPLHDAVIKGDIEQVTRLIEQGADVNARDNTGMTALIMASQEGHREIVEALRGQPAAVTPVVVDASSEPTRLTTNASSDGSPAWSPDGRRIAFQSDRDGNFEIYVMNVDGSGDEPPR